MSQMSQIRSLYWAFSRRSANIYVSKLCFAVVWLGQIHNLDTGHVNVLGLKSGSERLPVFKGGPEPLENDINKILGLKY